MPLNLHNETRLFGALVKTDGSDYNNRIERSIPCVISVILLIKHELLLFILILGFLNYHLRPLIFFFFISLPFLHFFSVNAKTSLVLVEDKFLSSVVLNPVRA